MKSRDCPMLVGMVTWPGERQSGREEGEGPLSQEKSLSASSLLQSLCCRLQRIITGLRVAVEEKDPANKRPSSAAAASAWNSPISSPVTIPSPNRTDIDGLVRSFIHC